MKQDCVFWFILSIVVLATTYAILASVWVALR